MLEIEKILEEKLQNTVVTKYSFSKKIIFNFIKKILYTKRLNQFLNTNKNKYGIEIIDELFEMLNFTYKVSNKDIKKIPAEGRLIVIANHPIGSLDGLALLKLIYEIRKDVKIIVNDILYSIDNLKEYFIPVNVFGRQIKRDSIDEIGNQLESEGALIIFPAGEVSRLKWFTVTDKKWNSGAVSFAKKYKSPILPIYIDAKNTWYFYIISSINKMFSTFLLIHEMFNKKDKTINILIGDPIPAKSFTENLITVFYQTKLLRKHLYNLRKPNKNIFVTKKNIIHPIDRKLIKKEINKSNILGTTDDNKKIILTNKKDSPNTLNEIARLRELTFRKVGEGTGKRYDLDFYDEHYYHLIVWDESELEIVGAYRLGFGNEIMHKQGIGGFYTNSLFNFSPDFTNKILPSAIELGRSFVQKKYWNTNVLFYLWQGIGAFLATNPQVKYLFGGVSISNSYPLEVRQMIVYVYRKWFGEKEDVVESKNRFVIPESELIKYNTIFTGNSFKDEYKILKQMLKPYNLTVPVLYKHYAELCEQEGVKFLDFGVDREFEECIDGFIVIDVDKIKPEKKEKYINYFLKGNNKLSLLG